LVVPGSEVQLGEELGTMELVDHRDRESILDGERVQHPVVDTEAPRPIGLLDEEDGRRERRVAVADDPLLHHGDALPLQLVLMCCGVPVRPDNHRLGVVLQNNVVVVRSLGWKTNRVREEPPKREQQRLQEGASLHCCPQGRYGGPVHPGLGDRAPQSLEGHAPAAKVPNNGPQLAEPPGAEDDVVPG
jgi:hypothetical protein